MNERGKNVRHYDRQGKEEVRQGPAPALQTGPGATVALPPAPGAGGAERPAGEPGDQAGAGGAPEGEPAAGGGVEYREVPGHPDYLVGSDGSVCRRKRTFRRGDGYLA